MRFVITYLYVMACLLAITLGSPASASVQPHQLYQGPITFEIVRNGKSIGQHITTFKEQGESVHIDSDMDLKISFLGIPLYSFSYKSEEIWEAGNLKSVNVHVDDNGEKQFIFGQMNKDGFEIRAGDKRLALSSPLLTTNHWNPEVTDKKQVLNTLTGNINKVEIVPRGEEEISIKGGKLSAFRYDYSGDL
ncbi:MAG: DUF6134 family protein, partial [Alphaproteobacteria bacterium]|nr:DUF6134 family protein [Alphaproteobacteria bacterium]